MLKAMRSEKAKGGRGNKTNSLKIKEFSAGYLAQARTVKRYCGEMVSSIE